MAKMADLDAFVVLLGAADPKAREKAAKAIGFAAHKGQVITSAVPALADALCDKDANVRAFASLTLMLAGRNGSDVTAAMPALARAICESEIDTRNPAINTLLDAVGIEAGKACRETAISALVDSLGEPDDVLRQHARPEMILQKAVLGRESAKSLDELAAEFRKGYSAARKKYQFQDKAWLCRIERRLYLVLGKIANKKNELASKRDILLEGKPKAPKAGARIYQTTRRVSYG